MCTSGWHVWKTLNAAKKDLSINSGDGKIFLVEVRGKTTNVECYRNYDGKQIEIKHRDKMACEQIRILRQVYSSRRKKNST